MSKNKIMKTLMTLLSIMAIGGTLVYAQNVDGKMVAAENLLRILEKTENRVISHFESITESGEEVPPEAQELLSLAQQLHVEAQTLYAEEKYEECIKKATEALNKYGETLGKAHIEEDMMDPLEEELEEETEQMAGLLTAIMRSRSRIEKLGEIADGLDELEIDTSEARSLIDDAESILNELESLLESGELMEPGVYLGEANGLIGQATGMLRSIGQPRKQERVQQFIQSTIHRAGALEQKMNRMLIGQGIPNHGVSEEFMGIVSGLRGLDSHADLKDAIMQLKEYVRNINRVGRSNEDEHGLVEGMVSRLNAQSRLGALIEACRNRLNSIEDMELVATLNALLDEAESLLAESMEALVAGDEETAEQLLDSVEQLLEEFQEAFKEALMERATRFSPPTPDHSDRGKRPTE
jgi:hypothetical protein